MATTGLRMIGVKPQRKLKANRENARKSTGPKTPRGKAFSRLNAIKHGFFLTSTTDSKALETLQEYEDLLNRLWDQYQPIGRAEEEEAERIGLCHWRFQRACRYENAANLVARQAFGRKQLLEHEESIKEMDKLRDAAMLQLQSAKKEIEETGEISQKTKQQIFALCPGSEHICSRSDKVARERPEELGFSEEGFSKEFQKLSPQMRSSIIAMHNIEILIATIERAGSQNWIKLAEIVDGLYAVPDREALDRLLRYETTFDRSLTRALDRLERLQRRRNSGPIRPELNRIQ